MRRLLAGLAVVFVLASSAPCFADYCPGGCEVADDDAPSAKPQAPKRVPETIKVADEYPPHIFEFGVRVGVGFQYLGDPCFLQECAGTWVHEGPAVAIGAVFRIGSSNFRWENQLEIDFAAKTWASWATPCYPSGTYDCLEGFAWGGADVPVFMQVLLTTGVQGDSHPNARFAFLWNLGLTLGGWTSIGTQASGVSAGIKLGLGVKLLRNWEVTTQFVGGYLWSAQVLLGYNVQFGR